MRISAINYQTQNRNQNPVNDCQKNSQVAFGQFTQKLSDLMDVLEIDLLKKVLSQDVAIRELREHPLLFDVIERDNMKFPCMIGPWESKKGLISKEGFVLDKIVPIRHFIETLQKMATEASGLADNVRNLRGLEADIKRLEVSKKMVEPNKVPDVEALIKEKERLLEDYRFFIEEKGKSGKFSYLPL